jgi:hypothetical protein
MEISVTNIAGMNRDNFTPNVLRERKVGLIGYYM